MTNAAPSTTIAPVTTVVAPTTNVAPTTTTDPETTVEPRTSWGRVEDELAQTLLRMAHMVAATIPVGKVSYYDV